MTTIHQPSSRLYMKLDKLVLLADGRAMYSGRADLVHVWFEALGCKLPYGMNVADYILDLANGEFTGTQFAHADSEASKRALARVRPRPVGPVNQTGSQSVVPLKCARDRPPSVPARPRCSLPPRPLPARAFWLAVTLGLCLGSCGR